MALIKCSECGADISDKEKNCPNCGKKIEKSQKESKKENGGKILIAIIGVIAIGLACLFAFGPNFNSNENKVDEDAQEVLDMLSEVRWAIEAPRLNSNDKLYITDVSKCDDIYSVDIWYYNYYDEYTTQKLITNTETGELVNIKYYDGDENGTMYSNRDSLEMYSVGLEYQSCLRDNRDGVEDTFSTFSEEQIDWLNQNLVVE